MNRAALFFTLLIFGFCYTCSAGDPFVVRYLGIDQGLSNNAVTCIYQDYQGFMWFGTYDGLNRYDGYSFQVFRNIIGDSTSLSGNHIYKIAGDARHHIWVGGLSGVSVYDPGRARFRQVDYMPVAATAPKKLADEIHTIVRVGDEMLVGAQGNGLIVFSNDKRTGKQIPLDLKTGRTGNYSVTCIAYDSLRQKVWVFVNGAGMCRYDPKSQSLVVVNPGLQQAICSLMLPNGDVLIGTDNGLFSFNGSACTFGDDWFNFRIKVNSIIEDEQHSIWIGSDGAGLWKRPFNENTPVPYQSGKDGEVNSNAIYALYEDAEGRKWVGTLRGGINILETKASSFRKISINGGQGGAGDFILSFCEDDRSNIWIGTDGAGLTRWNRTDNSFTRYVHDRAVNSVSSNFITNIAEDYTHALWISTWFGGINRLDMATGKFSHYPCYNPITRQDENNVWLVYEDSHQRLWASATNDGRLYTFNRAGDRFDLFDNSITNFQTLAEDSAGNFWGGNYTSLVRLDIAGKHHKIYPMGYPVRCIHEDRHHHFWVGTESGGLLLFDRLKGTYDRITTKDGLPSNTILRILEDGNGNLWLSTYNGLCKFDPVKRTFRNFSASDGLQSNQFSFNAALALRSGEFLFGGIKGFNVLNPDSIYDRKTDPSLFLTGLRINNTAVQDDDSYVSGRDGNDISQVSIPYDKAVVSLDFTALEYSDVDKLKYAYYLKGWDKDWNLVGNSRIANYAHLREGDFTFFVKVMNADGLWGKEQALLKVVVLPPWYRTWWAYCTYLLIVTLLIYVYLGYNKRQERLRYEIKLAHFEREKGKEIAEKRASFFTHISHEFRTPLTLIINPLKELLSDEYPDGVHKKARMIHRNARRLLSLVDQLLLFRKVESVDQQMRIEPFDLSETCQEVFLSFHQHAAANQINFHFDKPDHPVWLYGDREKIEIILFNLVSNAFKYTAPHGKITLELSDNDDEARVRVADSGVGIPLDVGEKLFEIFYQADNAGKGSQTGFGIGLYVSRKLALAHKGDLRYRSEEGKGSEFTLALQKGTGHLGGIENGSAPGAAGRSAPGGMQGSRPGGKQDCRSGEAPGGWPGASKGSRPLGSQDSRPVGSPGGWPGESQDPLPGSLEESLPDPMPEKGKTGSRILQELIEDPELNREESNSPENNESQVIDKIMSGLPKMVVADDNVEMRTYLKEVFKYEFSVYEAADGMEAYSIVIKEMPEIVISDVIMSEMDGIALCKKIKETELLAHIPVILLTGSASEGSQLKGIEVGAEDYIVKPFDKDLIIARVQNILKGRDRLQQYFFSTVTLKPLAGIEEDHKEFIERCIQIIENHLDDPDFTIPVFCREIGMSHPNLYKKIKAVSGLTVNVFIRYLRLRKAAQLFVQTNRKTSEVAYLTGFNDVKYFREQFFKLFGMKPADFIQRYRNLPGKAEKNG